MISIDQYCVQCGAGAAGDSKYCFKCGARLQGAPLAAITNHGLEEKFKNRIGSNVAAVEYKFSTRVWIEGGRFQVIQNFVSDLCSLAIERSSEISPEESNDECYDTISGAHFPRYDTDFYPPDGYESVFVELTDDIPSPFGNLGAIVERPNFLRHVRIFKGIIEPNPDHGKNNYPQTQPPRLRKSKLVEKWGIAVWHRFVDRKATNNFEYSLPALEMISQMQISPNYRGLISELGLRVVSGDGRGADINSLPEVQKALAGINGDIHYASIYEEEWEPKGKVWRPFFTVGIKTGWFSSQPRKIYLDPYVRI